MKLPRKQQFPTNQPWWAIPPGPRWRFLDPVANVSTRPNEIDLRVEAADIDLTEPVTVDQERSGSKR